ncbi:UNKNOWN [Stylonychia lemnae]|uniref:Uncharacterized protein n=1 Tax=Stylonychia lemnae TaxID=5949 RepID=A0A078AG50_STYLE|nr:UNKNOWN [Stylonychia lemnae]|eukprot:CDW80447.1 UNKNOWN [Stylonychia lemnae]
MQLQRQSYQNTRESKDSKNAFTVKYIRDVSRLLFTENLLNKLEKQEQQKDQLQHQNPHQRCLNNTSIENGEWGFAKPMTSIKKNRRHLHLNRSYHFQNSDIFDVAQKKITIRDKLSQRQQEMKRPQTQFTINKDQSGLSIVSNINPEVYADARKGSNEKHARKGSTCHSKNSSTIFSKTSATPITKAVSKKDNSPYQAYINNGNHDTSTIVYDQYEVEGTISGTDYPMTKVGSIDQDYAVLNDYKQRIFSIKASIRAQMISLAQKIKLNQEKA